MKERFLKKSLEIIKNKDSSIDEEKLEEIIDIRIEDYILLLLKC